MFSSICTNSFFFNLGEKLLKMSSKYMCLFSWICLSCSPTLALFNLETRQNQLQMR